MDCRNLASNQRLWIPEAAWGKRNGRWMLRQLNVVNSFSTGWPNAYQSQCHREFLGKIFLLSNLDNASWIEALIRWLNDITRRASVGDFPQIRNGEQRTNGRNALALVVVLFGKRQSLLAFNATKARFQIRRCRKELNQLGAAH